MRISAKEKLGPYESVVVCTPEGEQLPLVFEIDTDKKSLDMYVKTSSGKLATVQGPDGRFAIMTSHWEPVQYDVVDRHTGEVLAEVR